MLQGISPAFIHHIFETMDKEHIQKMMGFDELAYQLHLQMHEKGMETNQHSLFYFLLKDKHSHQAIGECGFHTWNKKHQRAEVFYKLFSDEHKRQGLMTEALEQVLEYGFKQMQVHRIEALVWHENVPSIKLLQKFGFQFEGTKREDYLINGIHENSECYSLLSWEWKKN